MSASGRGGGRLAGHTIGNYALAVLGVILAGTSHRWLTPFIGDSPPMRLLLIVTVTLAGWRGGLWPALLATGLGLIAIVAADDLPGDLGGLVNRLIRFGSLALLISLLFQGLHASRRRAEQQEREYRRSELRYRHLVETAGEGIWVLDRDEQTTFANRRLGEILGIPASALIGRRLHEFLADPRDVTESWLTVPSNSPASHEVRLKSADGQVRNTIMSAWPIHTEDSADAGEPSPASPPGGLLLKVTDVTRLKQAEDALSAKESVLRSFYESSPRGMGVIEFLPDDALFVSANTTLSTTFGLAPGALEGSTAKSLGAPPELIGLWAERFAACRASGRPIRFEYSSDWPDGHAWVAATIDTMVTPGSGRILCSFILEDITKMKKAEDDLREAKELAEAASQAKDRFLAVLSHELRTPLNPALIAVSSLLDSNPDPKLVPTLEMIRRNIELESRLIDDLLDLSRIVRGRLILDLETVDIHQAIDRAVEMCGEETAAARLEVVVELNAPRHHVNADHARVMQVVWNLIRNAAKFTRPGGRLTIRTSNTAGDAVGGDHSDNGFSDRIAIEFEDTGVGIDSGELTRIFAPFEQGGDERRGRSAGLGLGLTISRSLAEALGGRLTASSPGLGLGSTFRLELTTTPAPPPPIQGSDHPIPSTPAFARADRPPLHILVVEDNQDTLRFLATVLRDRGHVVATADTLAAARDAYHWSISPLDEALPPFDLLISDIELPDGDGLELIREISDIKAIPAIAMSGFGAEEDLRLSREAGFADHLIKPIDLNRLDAAIRRVTAQRNQEAPLESFGSLTKSTGSGTFNLF